MNILENLDMLLNEQNLSKRKFAFEIGVSPSTVHSWYQRNFENISLGYLIKISDYFKITIDELVYGKKEKNVYEEQFEKLIKYLEFQKGQLISVSNSNFTFKCNKCNKNYVVNKNEIYKQTKCPNCKGDKNESSDLY